MLSYEQICQLIELVAKTGIGAVEIETGDSRLRIVGDPVAAAAELSAGRHRDPAPALAVEASATEGSAGSSDESQDHGDELPPGTQVLQSEIVGTFYAAPSPGAEPFVSVGDRVQRGQVLCIVEAMKLMNEVESDTDGIVTRVLAENAQPVEYGQPLFGIRPDAV